MGSETKKKEMPEEAEAGRSKSGPLTTHADPDGSVNPSCGVISRTSRNLQTPRTTAAIERASALRLKKLVRQAIVRRAQSGGPGLFRPLNRCLRHREIADSLQAIVPEERDGIVARK